jgi:transcriptional regulator with XRE-family HTH domain
MTSRPDSGRTSPAAAGAPTSPRRSSAARASLHRTEIGLLEHGKRVARVDTLIKLAGAMAIPPSDLLEGIHWTPGDPRSGGFSFSERRAPAPRRRRRGEA